MRRVNGTNRCVVTFRGLLNRGDVMKMTKSEKKIGKVEYKSGKLTMRGQRTATNKAKGK